MLYREANDRVLGQIDTTESLFNDLEGNFKFVEDRTRALQTSCEKLLAEQVRCFVIDNIYLSNFLYVTQD